MTQAAQQSQPEQTPQPDYGRIKSNIATMIDKGAPENDIDEYVASEGVTPEQLQKVPHGPASDANPAALDTSGTLYQSGFTDEVGAQPKSKLAPEDEAHLVELLRAGHDDLAAQFAASKGVDISNAAAIKQAREQTGAVNPDFAYTLPALKDLPRDLTQGAGMAAARGVADVVPGVGNLTALTRTIDSELGLGGASTGRSFGDEFAFQQDLGAGAKQGDEADHPWMRIAGQLLGSLAIPSGLEGVGLQAGTDVLRTGGTMADARAAASIAVRNRMAQVGGAYGVAHGALGADSPESAVTGAITEGALGGIAGAGLGALGQAKVARAAAHASAPLTEAEKFADAASRQKIDYLPADRPDALPTQWASSLTRLTLGGIPLTEAAQKVVESAKGARDRIANTIGNFRTNDGGGADVVYAGQRLQRGAQAFLNQSEKRAGDLYAAIPIAADRPAVLTNTRAVLDDLTKGFSSNPALSKLWADNPRLRATLDAITPAKTPIMDPANLAPNQVATKIDGGQLAWDDLKHFRSIVGRIVGQPSLTSNGDENDALRKLYGGLSADMRATAEGAGPQATKAFERANSYFSGRQKRIEDTLSPIFGSDLKATPEDAYRALLGWSKKQGGDFASVARTIRSLPEDDANTVRASILDNMGTVSKGRQDQTGNVFSPADFVTHWNELSDRAKNTLFQGEARKAIDDLVTVASGMKASGKFANNSKTGIAIGATGTISSVVANPLLGTLGVVGQIGAGKLLGSPAVARWLAAYSRKPNPQAALSKIQQLTAIARAEPAIANEVLQLQQRLAEAFTTSPSARLAADEGHDRTTEVGATGQPQEQQNEAEGAQR